MYWEAEKECIGRESLRQLQLERLQSTVVRVYMNVPFYRKKFDELGIDPDSFRSLEDVNKLPFTSKDDLRMSYPYGMFAVPLREVVRVQTSSGTTGMPTAVGYTRNDIKIWSNLAARILAAGGVTQNDIVQIAFDYGLFTGALGLHYGAERLGASVIPISSVNARRQVKIMQDFKTTALMCTPGYALLIADAIMEMGINVNSMSLKYGLFGAEPWSEAMRNELQEKLRIVATDNYGLSEVMSPGVAGECQERNGLHINEDHFLVEVVDPETLDPLPEGKTGELVVTTLTKEAFPVIRFRTRDLTSLITGPCPCGRTFIRISPQFIFSCSNLYWMPRLFHSASIAESNMTACPRFFERYWQTAAGVTPSLSAASRWLRPWLLMSATASSLRIAGSLFHRIISQGVRCTTPHRSFPI